MDILFCVAIVLLFIFLLVLTKLYSELEEKIENIESDFSHLDSRITHRSDAISDYISDLSACVYINENQILNIAKTSADFFCNINNRIADISTSVDTLDANVDYLFVDVSDIKKKFDSPHLVFFSKRRDKSG